MAVTLVVGIVLITGVVAPVIASTMESGDSGSGETYTNEGTVYYKVPTESTSFTYHYAPNGYYLEEDGELYTLNSGLNVFSQSKGQIGIYASSGNFSVRIPEVANQLHPTSIDMNGSTMSFTNPDNDQTYEVSDIVLYQYPTGEYVDVLAGNPANPTLYASQSSYIACYYWTGYDGVTFLGTQNNSSLISTLYDEANRIIEINDTFIPPISYVSSDNQLKYIVATYNEDPPGNLAFIIDPNFDVDEIPEDMELGSNISVCILPVEVTVEGSGSGGLSPTLSNILSVIPLLMVVGLILGVLTYLRMKN